MRRFSIVCLLVLGSSLPLTAKDIWVRVQSPHFFLIGNDSEKNIRRAAVKFEQFRAAFSQIFPRMKLNSSVPTRVLVFKSDAAFKPFKPLYEGKPASLAAFYQKGTDVNHICLTSQHTEERPFAAIYHEYVHQLIGDNLQASPIWFQEGIAEYYSPFDVSDENRRVSVGRAWALVHYLIEGDAGKHKPKLIEYLNLLASGLSLEESFAKAFRTDYATLERDLRNYIERDTFTSTFYKFEKEIPVGEIARAEPLSDAEVSFYLGDLLMYKQRFEEAELHLKESLASNPNLAPALASLGILCLHQKQWPEAQNCLQKAVAADSNNYLVHFHYASLLAHHGEEKDIPAGLPDERYRTVQAEAKKAIELAPWFVESYRLLAYAANLTGEGLAEALELLKRAQAYAPGRQDLRLDIARLRMRSNDYVAARRLLEPIARQDADPQSRQEAEVLLAHLQSVEERQQLVEMAQRQAIAVEEETLDEQRPAAAAPPRPTLSRKADRAAPSAPHPQPSLEAPRPGGEKAAGILIRVDCLDNMLVFVVKSGTKSLRLHVAEPGDLLLYNKSGDNLGTIEMKCGPLSPPAPVVATYRKPAGTADPYDGTLLSVLFVER
ncbi:MAG: tetratricopeptide repeat protein [Acidimicrobiia bacterium]|nr:tetratricopeptide repeat protein [Acidimicrobiia bacterium]